MIDFHQHLGHFGRSVEHMLAHQEVHGVRQSVLLPISGSATPPEHWTFDEAASALERYPDRLIHFCHLDPYRPDALEAMREGIAQAEAEPKADVSLLFDHAYVDPPRSFGDDLAELRRIVGSEQGARPAEGEDVQV